MRQVNNKEKRARVNKLSAREKRRKFLTNIKHSKTHYKGKTVQQSYIQVDIIKKLKKKRSTLNGVISRLYKSTKERNECRYKLACTEQPYIRTQLATVKLERNAINPRIKRLKKPLEIMNAKARRAELSRMIDGTNYSYRYKTQLAIAASVIKNPDSKKRKKHCYTNNVNKMYIHVRTKLAMPTIINTNKSRTTNKLSKNQYIGNSVIYNIVNELIKKHKKKRSTPNGVKARLYIATGIRSERAGKKQERSGSEMVLQ